MGGKVLIGGGATFTKWGGKVAHPETRRDAQVIKNRNPVI
jgi:hypothetical protein